MHDMTNGTLRITRRAWSRLLGGTACWSLLRCTRAAALPAIERLTWDTSPVDIHNERRYRADAQVLLLSIPLLRREDVGSGSVVWKESAVAGGATLRLLEFTGFSRPDRAAGLNRLGFLREISRMTGDLVSESLYLGVMTSSPEESVEQARQALHSRASEVTYTAIDGRIQFNQSQTVTAHFTAPSGWSIDNQGELLDRAQRALATVRQDTPETHSDSAGAPPFLQAVAGLLRQPGQNQTSYAYSGRLYRLSLSQAADPQATAHFRARGLLAANDYATCASGKVRRENGGAEHHFRLWFQQGAQRPLPLRIEYSPKSYLRLVFEAQG